MWYGLTWTSRSILRAQKNTSNHWMGSSLALRVPSYGDNGCQYQLVVIILAKTCKTHTLGARLRPACSHSLAQKHANIGLPNGRPTHCVHYVSGGGWGLYTQSVTAAARTAQPAQKVNLNLTYTTVLLILPLVAPINIASGGLEHKKT